MNNPLASIFILTYNNFEFIEDCINSVFEQDYPYIEFIVSDDCSANFPEEYFEDLIKRKPSNIKYFILNRNKQNYGLVKNLNIALQKSTGKYILGISQDDIFADRNVISEVVKYFQDTNALIVTGYREIYDYKMKKIIRRLPGKEDIIFLRKIDNDLYKRLCFGNFISGASTCYSRELFDRYGFYDEKYILLEDYSRFLALARQKVKFHFIDKVLIKYRTGGISSNTNKNSRLLRDFSTLYQEEIFKYSHCFSFKEIILLKHIYYKRKLQFLKTSKSLKYFIFPIVFAPVIVLRRLFKIYDKYYFPHNEVID